MAVDIAIDSSEVMDLKKVQRHEMMAILLVEMAVILRAKLNLDIAELEGHQLQPMCVLQIEEMD
jgi:hypothetical protein